MLAAPYPAAALLEPGDARHPPGPEAMWAQLGVAPPAPA